MKNPTVIYESPTKWDFLSIEKYLKQGVPIWVTEPFHAYHYRKGIRFFAPQIPDFVNNLIKKGKVNLLKVSQFNAKDIYRLSADKAVDIVEAVYPEYRKEHKKLFEFVTDSLKSAEAENVFKKNLCEKLAEFYSVNILLYRIEKLLGPDPILFYPDTNVRSYLHLKSLLSKSDQTFFKHPSIRFPVRTHIAAFFENLGNYLITMVKLSAQTLASGFLGGFRMSKEKKKKGYSYGVAIVVPHLQLKGNQRGPDFIIDNNKIRAEDVVYLPLVDLTKDQKKQLARIPGEVYYLPKIGQYFSHFTEWKRLFSLALKKNFLRNAEEINIACNAFFHYFRWLNVLADVKFRHFITNCDFGVGHVGRNLALNQTGVQTWYFTDSMNLGCNLKVEEEKCNMRHPFWTYLGYDHFVTWNDFLVQYYKDHPGSIKQAHVVGCLWSSHIKGENKVKIQNGHSFTFKNLGNSFKLVAFDSTYSRNGVTSYTEGLVFTEHLLQLVDACQDIHIFLKEKRDRNKHRILDPVLGPKLLDLYKKMDNHPRITTCSYYADASELIDISDMVISFPFTSTTFEALSANKVAIWHDPLGYYISTPYARLGGVTTHSYEELRAKVLEIKAIKPGTYQKHLQTNSPLMDPYQDGKSVDRFRELLYSAEESMK